MDKVYRWEETTTGHIMTVNGTSRWFVRKDPHHDTRWEVNEIVQGDSGYLLRDFAYSLIMAKRRAYLIECQERNSRREMQLAE
jgi:hypothetical protein